MITGFLLSILYSIVAFFIGLLPYGQATPAAWLSGIYQIWGAVNAYSFVVPVGMLVTCLGLAMSFHLFVFLWKALHWVYGLIRGSRYH